MTHKNIIGLDIGGTKITGIVWNGGKILKVKTISTPKTLVAFRRELLNLVEKLKVSGEVEYLGVGMAGFVDNKHQTVLSSPNLPFINKLSFKSLFKNLEFKKIAVDNDASCFLKAEIFLGKLKNKNIIGIIYGTGVGGAFYLKGKFYRGVNNLGGEIGQMILNNKLTWEDEFKIYRDKNNYKKLAFLTAQRLAVLIKLFSPEKIIFGGGVATNSGSKFIPQATSQLRVLLANKKQVPKILISRFKHAGAIGATLLFK